MLSIVLFMFTNRDFFFFIIIICFKALLKANASVSQGVKCVRESPGRRMAIVEQVPGLPATAATGELCNNDTSMDQMSCIGLGFKMRGCCIRRTCVCGVFYSNVHNLFKKFAGVRIFIEVRELRNCIQLVR